MLGSVYNLWQLQAAALWLWGSDKDSMDTRDRVGSREGTVPGPSGSEVSPCIEGCRGDSPATGSGAAGKHFLQKIWTVPEMVAW